MLSLECNDLTVLPQGLLAQVKSHCRVEFDRDDQYLLEATSRAIAEVETLTNLSINPAEWKWCIGDCVPQHRGYWRFPKAPVRSVFSVDDKDVRTPVKFYVDEAQVYLCATSGGGNYIFNVGYLTAADIPPAVLSAILMRVAALYEYRESLQFGSVNELPDMDSRVFSGLWRPSC